MKAQQLGIGAVLAAPAGLLAFGLMAAACSSSSAPAQNPPPQYAPAPNAPGYPAQPGFPQPGAPGPAAGVATQDPISTANLPFLRQQAQAILTELVAALPPAKQQRVAGIPLVVDDTPGEVNAFAACSETGRSAMAITDGLLQIQAALAQAQAHDELFATRSVDSYIQMLASSLRPGQPVPPAPASLFPNGADTRVLARQAQVFEEQVAFVMGHELGHHHLSHLPCTAGADPVGAAELGRVLSSQVPLFNQPNEITADLAGIYNVLDAGRIRAARGAFAWSEGGALLTMRFFAGLEQLSPAQLLTAFQNSHPPPQLRTPIIQQATATWRSTGGAPWPLLGF